MHAAAVVNLIFPYQALKSNVHATRNILLFCANSKVKPLQYISTNGIFPKDMLNCSEGNAILRAQEDNRKKKKDEEEKETTTKASDEDDDDDDDPNIPVDRCRYQWPVAQAVRRVLAKQGTSVHVEME